MHRARPAVLLVLAASCAAASPYGGDPALDLADLDLEADPGADFYRYANGGWLDAHEIPASESSWGVVWELRERNRDLLRGLLDGLLDGSASGRHARLVGDYYAAAMDAEGIEARGLEDLAPELEAIDALGSLEELPTLLAELHAIGVPAFFSLSSLPDFDDPSVVMAIAFQDGMGLPEKEYYFREGDEAEALRRQYVEHVAALLALAGRPDAEGAAERILTLETRLAEGALSAVESRDPSNLAAKVPVSEANASTPSLAWDAYLAGVGLADLEVLDLPAPAYWAGLDAVLRETPLEDLRSYLVWQLLDAYASKLDQAFVEQDFAFRGRVLTGSPELQPRWKRVLGDLTQSGLGEALGRLYVERAFGEEAKQRAESMVRDLISAYRSRLQEVEWMGEETRARAIAKLDALRYKIGYPDAWREYEELELSRDSYARNAMALAAHERRRDLAKVGGPVDEDEWGMPPHMINAYYHPLHNEIVFPAAILQPPLFDAAYDDALNYGAMGAVIGHEITHGFDDTGSQFDADGALRNWWTEEDRAEFERRAAVLVEQFDAYEALDGLHVNGELTLGENIADLGGLRIAYDALQLALEPDEREPIDGFTPEQRFFLAYARAWCAEFRPEALSVQVNTDPHSPARFRVLGPLSNLEAFAAAFDVEEGEAMARPAAERASIW